MLRNIAAVSTQANALTRVRVLSGQVTTNTRPFSSFNYQNILAEKRERGVGFIKLNRPKQLNALCDDLMSELNDCLKRFDVDKDVRAIVITGSDKAFAAGADIKEMSSRNFAEVQRIDMLSTWQNIRSVKKPIIAAVNGYALGGGCELAMSCDICIAGDGAQFGQPEVLIGTVPGAGGSQRLARAVGKSKAMEWILTGKRFSATEAERAGLVSRVVPSDKLVEEAIKLAEEIASLSSPVIQIAKECVNRSYESSLNEGLLYELRQFHSTWGLKDRDEGMKAFADKRKPEWKHE
jgi:enoyl-CoA hydratase